jgi:hypothetical protein
MKIAIFLLMTKSKTAKTVFYALQKMSGVRLTVTLFIKNNLTLIETPDPNVNLYE